MRRDVLPASLATSAEQMEAALRRAEAHGRAGAIEGTGDHVRLDRTCPTALGEQRVARSRVSRRGVRHDGQATQLSKPRRSTGRLRLRPMNTRRDERASPARQGPMKSPSAIMCTAWNA